MLMTKLVHFIQRRWYKNRALLRKEREVRKAWWSSHVDLTHLRKKMEACPCRFLLSVAPLFFIACQCGNSKARILRRFRLMQQLLPETAKISQFFMIVFKAQKSC